MDKHAFPADIMNSLLGFSSDVYNKNRCFLFVWKKIKQSHNKSLCDSNRWKIKDFTIINYICVNILALDTVISLLKTINCAFADVDIFTAGLLEGI